MKKDIVNVKPHHTSHHQSVEGPHTVTGIHRIQLKCESCNFTLQDSDFFELPLQSLP